MTNVIFEMSMSLGCCAGDLEKMGAMTADFHSKKAVSHLVCRLLHIALVQANVSIFPCFLNHDTRFDLWPFLQGEF